MKEDSRIVRDDVRSVVFFISSAILQRSGSNAISLRLAEELPKWMSVEDAAAFKDSFKVESALWKQALAGFLSHDRVGVVGYLRTRFRSVCEKERAYCYYHFSCLGWPDFLEFAQSDQFSTRTLLIRNPPIGAGPYTVGQLAKRYILVMKERNSGR